VHHLVERIDVPGPQGVQHAWVLATNVYVKTRRAGAWWRTTPARARCRTAADDGDAPSTLH
jgi:hypothetical protein